MGGSRRVPVFPRLLWLSIDGSHPSGNGISHLGVSEGSPARLSVPAMMFGSGLAWETMFCVLRNKACPRPETLLEVEEIGQDLV